MIRVVLAVVLSAGATVFGPATAAGHPDPSRRTPAGWSTATSAAGVAVAYVPPVPGPLDVVRGFDPPATPYGPGHLGVDLRVAAHQTVVAAGTGVVTFAGPVAGRGVVVVAHADGVSTEYEPVDPLVHRGDTVAAGTPIGVLDGTHPGCPARFCVHWGARRDGTYLDPLSLLAPLQPVRLLPWHGS